MEYIQSLNIEIWVKKNLWISRSSIASLPMTQTRRLINQLVVDLLLLNNPPQQSYFILLHTLYPVTLVHH